MSTRVAIHYVIEQRFALARLPTHWLRLRPAPLTRANVTAYSLAVQPQPHFLNWIRDPFENQLARLDLPEPVTSLRIEVELIAELEPINPFDFLTEPYAAEHPFSYPTQLSKELTPYLQVPPPGPRMRAWLAQLDRTPVSTVARLDLVNQTLRAAHTTGAAKTRGVVDPERVLERGSPDYWELAWLLTLSFRHLGLAARFVCGVRVGLGEGASPDSASLHAWSEAYIPGAGWIGLDPDAGLFCSERHIPFAAAPDPLRALPISGDLDARALTQVETMHVRRLEPSKPSWPCSDAEWSDIRALGGQIEADLQRQQVQPTLATTLSLVSKQAAAPEWNTSVIGPSKRLVAEALLASLQPLLAPGGVIHVAQAEWYAGEALPRWRLGCFSRADGKPVWRDPERLGWCRPADTFSRDAARSLACAIADTLGLEASILVPAFEDALHDRWRARGVREPEPLGAELRDPALRRALADRLSLGREEPVGFVLPIRPDALTGAWIGSRWLFRRERLYLLPGDSPMGYRLPLDSLAVDEQGTIEAGLEPDPFAERAELPEFHAATRITHSDHARRGSAPRTALCVEWRAGRLHVFFPPIAELEHYLALMAAVEASAASLDVAVVLEGYEPPEDVRLRRLLLEPAAGVLRVTLPETRTWGEHLASLHATYAEAERAGLRAERLLPDEGERLSSGPSRLMIGGVRPATSPFLTRPQLLGSMIRYWQRHPSLSYLFAGRLIGPSGASPRPDEGRDEALYELSIALEHLPEGESTALWQADRVLRHLLTDPAGDLKHAELRVDQLYPPDRASLRLGRLQIHAFETAPEERIAALQSLLVLGLLGRFARRPEQAPLVRWGTALHDRFMLPGVLEADFRTVIEDLNAVGYPVQWAWFQALTALRFPVLGTVQIGAIGLELRSAHEPWPLLAEEVTAAGVARFIDAACERVQVRLSGLAPARYVLTCNGHFVPLQRMIVDGEYVAGVRFKAANPPATLHPTLAPVHALVFDLLDTWTGQLIGGCTYYPTRRDPWWPGGHVAAVPSAPTTSGPLERAVSLPLPSVSVPAPGRRGRFEAHGRGGPRAAPAASYRDEAPYLLDLTLQT